MIMFINSLPIEGKEGLMEMIKRITDPRKPRGIRHPLPSILAMAVCTVLCGQRSYLGIAEWSKGLTSDMLKRFGCKRESAPSEPTIRRTLQSIDVEETDREISHWLASQNSLSGKAIATDGKTARGSRDGNKRPIHLLSAIVHKEGRVIAQKEVDEKTNEIKLVKPLFDEIDIKGAVVTTDALLTQRKFAKYLIEEKEADYVFTVKENQPTLYEDIKDLNLRKEPYHFRTLDKAHGRIEERKIWVSSELKGYSDFPYAEQVFMIERYTTKLDGSCPSTEIAYGITSLSAEKASPERLLSINRGHWEIENRLHWVRDVTFDEDRSQIRKGKGPHCMASLRNLVISIFRMLGFKYIPSGIRYFIMHLENALGILGI